MSKTKHIQRRMSQRAIDDRLLDLVRTFGISLPNGKIILNQKGIRDLQDALKRLQRDAERAMQKGGLGLVMMNDMLITTYGLGQKKKLGDFKLQLLGEQ